MTIAALMMGTAVVACRADVTESGKCPAFNKDCAPGFVPTDTDGDGCPDQCRQPPPEAAAPDGGLLTDGGGK
jgi:hypothetical protein